MRGITKRFGSLVANDHIDLDVEPGQIHALLGENGAGKSTLMNVLYGLYEPDEGQIVIDGKPVSFANPKDAIAAGIGMVHQHFMLVPVFTVAENVTLGIEPVRSLPHLRVAGRLGLLDRRRARREVKELSARYNLDVDPDAVVEHLPVGTQQRVEIIKSLARQAEVLILDEPTAVLTPGETDELFAILKSLQASGRSVVFITHKLREVQAVADQVTVIRQGKVVEHLAPTATDAQLAAAMVGREVRLRVEKGPAAPGEVVLAISGLTVADDLGGTAVNDFSLEVRRGEIVGIAGVQGNGQTELCESLLGLRPALAGTVTIAGDDLTGADTRTVLRAGVGYVPEDRQDDGLVGDFTIAENLALDVYDQAPYSRGPALRLDALRDIAARQIAEFDVRTRSSEVPVRTLSGGNQQKVILARELSRPVNLLVASQPTRGLDIGSIEFVHKRIVAARDGGAGVLIVSSELDEIYALADRIAVMSDGRIIGIRPPTVSREELGLLMSGAHRDAPAEAAS
ncbi:ABC transporter ATP-binding protein [Acidiferrimicrobium sp. IK]|nr:ABC transporter ATP-binding protein [Acidiferrimicrobium sp. IK]